MVWLEVMFTTPSKNLSRRNQHCRQRNRHARPCINQKELARHKESEQTSGYDEPRPSRHLTTAVCVDVIPTLLRLEGRRDTDAIEVIHGNLAIDQRQTDEKDHQPSRQNGDSNSSHNVMCADAEQR